MSDFPSCATQAEGGAEPHSHNFQLQQGFFTVWPFPWQGQTYASGPSSAPGRMPGMGGQMPGGPMFGPGGQGMSPGWLPYMGHEPPPPPPQQQPQLPSQPGPITAMLYCTQCGLSYVFGLDGRWHKVEIGDSLRPEQPE